LRWLRDNFDLLSITEVVFVKVSRGLCRQIFVDSLWKPLSQGVDQAEDWVVIFSLEGRNRVIESYKILLGLHLGYKEPRESRI
jgi:hypothetical protein